MPHFSWSAFTCPSILKLFPIPAVAEAPLGSGRLLHSTISLQDFDHRVRRLSCSTSLQSLPTRLSLSRAGTGSMRQTIPGPAVSGSLFPAQAEVVHRVTECWSIVAERRRERSRRDGGCGKTTVGIATGRRAQRRQGLPPHSGALATPPAVYSGRREISGDGGRCQRSGLLNGPDTLVKLLKLRKAVGRNRPRVRILSSSAVCACAWADSAGSQLFVRWPYPVTASGGVPALRP